MASGASLAVIISARDQTHGALNSVKNSLGGILQTAAGFAVFQLGAKAIGAVTDNLGEMVAGAREAQQVQAQLNNVIKSTGGVAGVTAAAANQLATSLQNVTMFEDDAIVGGQNLLLTFTGIGKDVFPAATETMLDMSQALGQDLKSSAIQLGKALNDPVAGISALSRVGVSFTEQQKEQIKTLMASGKTMQAQKVILAELNREFGGAAKAAATAAGPMVALGHRFDSIKDSIGAGLIPVLDTFGAVAVSVFETLQPGIENFIGLIGDLGAGFDDLLFEGNMFRRLRDLPGIIGEIFSRIGRIDWGGLLGNAGDLVGGLLGQMGDIGGRVAGFLGEQWQKINWDNVFTAGVDLGSKILETAGDFAGKAGTWLTAQLGAAWESLQGAWPSMWAKAGDIWSGLSGLLGAGASTLGTSLGNAWEGLKESWPTIWAKAGDVWAGLVSAAGNGVTQVGIWVANAWAGIKETWPVIWKGAGDAWASFAEAVGDGIKTVSDWVGTAVAGIKWQEVWKNATNVASGIAEGLQGISVALQTWIVGQITGMSSDALRAAVAAKLVEASGVPGGGFIIDFDPVAVFKALFDWINTDLSPMLETTFAGLNFDAPAAALGKAFGEMGRSSIETYMGQGMTDGAQQLNDDILGQAVAGAGPLGMLLVLAADIGARLGAVLGPALVRAWESAKLAFITAASKALVVRFDVTAIPELRDVGPPTSPGGNYSPVGRRALGGPVWPSASFLVGEQGPELFTPKTAGNIMPASVTKQMAGAIGSAGQAATEIATGLFTGGGQDFGGLASAPKALAAAMPSVPKAMSGIGNAATEIATGLFTGGGQDFGGLASALASAVVAPLQTSASQLVEAMGTLTEAFRSGVGALGQSVTSASTAVATSQASEPLTYVPPSTGPRGTEPTGYVPPSTGPSGKEPGMQETNQLLTLLLAAMQQGLAQPKQVIINASGSDILDRLRAAGVM